MAWPKSQRKLSSLSFVLVNSKPFLVVVSVKWPKLENVWFQWLLNVAGPLYVGQKFCSQAFVGWHNDGPDTFWGLDFLLGFPMPLFLLAGPPWELFLHLLWVKFPYDSWLIVIQPLYLIRRITDLYFYRKKGLERATGNKHYFPKLLVTRRPLTPTAWSSLPMCIITGDWNNISLSLWICFFRPSFRVEQISIFLSCT